MAYVIGSGVPYGKYLQAQALVDDLKTAQVNGANLVSTAIKTGTKEIIASQEALRDQNARLAKAVTDGFDQVTGAIEDLNATFVWGFNAVLCHTGRMADALEDLLAAVKSPTKTRAYEYFDDARTAFSRGHLRDALDLIEKAISGDHAASGYRLEWRFHLLKGSILVGTVAHPELLDLKSAEQTYRTAADYAATDDTDGAALALLGASWACYCQAQLAEALRLSDRALQYRPSFGEAHFQSAKILMAMERPEDGLSRLVAAVEEDPQYVLKAAGDGDFQAHVAKFEAWVGAQRQRKEQELRRSYAEVSKDARFWLRCVEEEVDLGPVAATLVRKEPGLFDLLCALSTVRSNTPEQGSPPRGVGDAIKVLRAVPHQLQIPSGLLEGLVGESHSWKVNTQFFEFTRILLKHAELDALHGVLMDRPDPEDAPLELFALLLDAFPADLSAKSALANALQGKSYAIRKDLIEEFETLTRSGTYSDATIEAIRSALAAQYERWWPAISDHVKWCADLGTEPPAEGVVARLGCSFFGLMIPLLIIGSIAGHATGFLVWLLGIAAVVGIPVITRSNIRAERLREKKEEEAKLRSRLGPELQASTATAATDSFRKSHPEAETLADFVECPRCISRGIITMIPPGEPKCPKCGWE